MVEAAISPLLDESSRLSGQSTCHCILDSGLYLGGGRVDTDKLRSLGITHIVRVVEDSTLFVLPEDEVQDIFSIQVADVRTSDLRPYFEGSSAFIANALRGNGKVYVHCAQGRSRSCCVVLAYLIQQEKMTLCTAWVHVLQRRDVHAINLGFLAQLVDLDMGVHGRQSLPLLSAFIVKVRWNQAVRADTSCKFDATEVLSLWRDPAANTRDITAAMATVMIKTQMDALRNMLCLNGHGHDGSSPSDHLHTESATHLCHQLHRFQGLVAGGA